MAVYHRVVETERGEISYILTKKNVKNVNMRIKPDGTVNVSAHTSISVKEIDGFVKEKADFVFDALEKFESRTQKKLESCRYVKGGTVYYLGEELTLDVILGKDCMPVKDGKYLIVVTGDPEDERRVGQLVYDFYGQELSRIFVDLMRENQVKLSSLGIPQASLKVRDMKSRWGTCHTGKNVITLNSKLIHTPYSCIEYVVLHEFCHLIHPNHSKEFYQLVSVYMPEWKKEREELKKWSARE